MSRGVNRVTIVGYLGGDPELRTMPNGNAVANFRIATTESWKDKQSGEAVERTEWHSLVAYQRLGEVCAEYLRKGSQVYIEGRLRTRKWQDKEGRDRYTTEIIVGEMQMLGRSPAGADQEREPQQRSSGAQSQPAGRPAPPTQDFDDDIPF